LHDGLTCQLELWEWQCCDNLLQHRDLRYRDNMLHGGLSLQLLLRGMHGCSLLRGGLRWTRLQIRSWLSR